LGAAAVTRALRSRRRTGSSIASVHHAIAASCTLALVASASGAAAAHGHAAPVRSASLHQDFFRSPSGDIECELDYHAAGSSQAHCQTGSPPRSVTMTPSGRLRTCAGIGCIGNPPLDVSVLAYGRRATLGPFRCLSLTGGVRCRVRSGRGFLISRSGIEHL
jgi:hypothetical protein